MASQAQVKRPRKFFVDRVQVAVIAGQLETQEPMGLRALGSFILFLFIHGVRFHNLLAYLQTPARNLSVNFGGLMG